MNQSGFIMCAIPMQANITNISTTAVIFSRLVIPLLVSPTLRWFRQVIVRHVDDLFKTPNVIA